MRVRYLFCVMVVSLAALSADAADSFIGGFENVSPVASTIPGNGDVNPYGVAVSPVTMGKLVEGNVLVSNFNNSANQQGTGTTIVEISPQGNVSLFASIDPAHLPGACPGGVGLTTALVVLRSGWVIVGSLPAAQGVPANAMAGCLIVLNDEGTPVETFSGAPINGPWDMTAFDAGPYAVLFVTNVLNGTVKANGNTVNEGTVVQMLVLTPDQAVDHHDIPLDALNAVIASGFGEQINQTALVIGPTGLGIGSDGTLYVADTLANRIAAIPQALFGVTREGTGTTVSEGGALNGPLGLAIAPNGDILTVNSLDGKIVETTPGGQQVAVKILDNTVTPGSLNGAGALFGLAVAPNGTGVYFVDDDFNTLNFLH
jgi:hypothetical protein